VFVEAAESIPQSPTSRHRTPRGGRLAQGVSRLITRASCAAPVRTVFREGRGPPR
jgi:hypothetical protein